MIGSLLLLLILTVVNVLVGLKFTGVIDATQSGQFTLSERTTNILKKLDQPVQNLAPERREPRGVGRQRHPLRLLLNHCWSSTNGARDKAV